jgi:hypothetical protein
MKLTEPPFATTSTRISDRAAMTGGLVVRTAMRTADVMFSLLTVGTIMRRADGHPRRSSLENTPATHPPRPVLEI